MTPTPTCAPRLLVAHPGGNRRARRSLLLSLTVPQAAVFSRSLPLVGAATTQAEATDPVPSLMNQRFPICCPPLFDSWSSEKVVFDK